MRVPIWVWWIGVTTTGCSLAVTLSTTLLGATGRPLAPVFGGIVVVALFGGVIGVVIAAAQFLALPRGAASSRAWILATLAGAAAGFAVASLVGEILGNIIPPTTNVTIGGGAIQMTFGAVVGFGVGCSQWLVLRRALPIGRWWIVASAVGAALGYGVALGALEVLEVPILKASLMPSFGAMLGLCVGVAQSLVLRSRVLR
jgi:hypothetical protein